MSEFTAKGLVKYCKDALNLKTVYMWGGLMKTVTKTFIDYKKKQYPAYYSDSRVALLETKIGNYYGCDCVGLIKSYLFGGVNSPKYKSKWDTNTRGMYSVSKTKGTIDTLPEQAGLILYMKGHVGVYIGNGECIECTLGKYGDGVVKTKVAGRGWTHWLMLPWIDYEDGVEAEEPGCKCECDCCKKKKNDELSAWVKHGNKVTILSSPYFFPEYVLTGTELFVPLFGKGLSFELIAVNGKELTREYSPYLRITDEMQTLEIEYLEWSGFIMLVRELYGFKVKPFWVSKVPLFSDENFSAKAYSKVEFKGVELGAYVIDGDNFRAGLRASLLSNVSMSELDKEFAYTDKDISIQVSLKSEPLIFECPTDPIVYSGTYHIEME